MMLKDVISKDGVQRAVPLTEEDLATREIIEADIASRPKVLSDEEKIQALQVEIDDLTARLENLEAAKS